jgi:uncharacterized protein (DUF2252 family)
VRRVSVKKKKYTVNDLTKNSKLYEENFKLLDEAYRVHGSGSPKHNKYAHIEKELNKIDVRIRNELGILVPQTHEHKRVVKQEKSSSSGSPSFMTSIPGAIYRSLRST